ncbi:response regulator transcription factor [Pseudobutyrivibrio xylanivorans]|uniref:Heme response regulator HssR n=1 Tax=Pseudobutyrivibrio xylanivorans DSM 14809 TaxID=1123012 RepID=A0A1M6DVN0_PSEXY|nr:response regulator transcription factor [Pseudobutyrivibrio xylanivorans]SHI77189.1 DNA-binding response regulator, OmpR family, contains REC and winged-helix (wHTH) domain [Pseudobutyrivibrio xylanivorans DSM 14809]
MVKILLVEDNSDLNLTVCRHLNLNNYMAFGCTNALDAYDILYENKIDLIISDIMMPDVDGFEFAKNVREENPNIPIIFMSAKDDLDSKKQGFRLGIDDYMVKPIDLDELILRIEAILRRANISSSNKLSIGTFEMDEESMSVTLDGEEIPFTTKEFQLLFKLLSYPNHAFSRNQLLEELGGLDNESTPRSIDVFITNIRAKLEGCTSFKIVTVRGIGYKGVIQ